MINLWFFSQGFMEEHQYPSPRWTWVSKWMENVESIFCLLSSRKTAYPCSDYLATLSCKDVGTRILAQYQNSLLLFGACQLVKLLPGSGAVPGSSGWACVPDSYSGFLVMLFSPCFLISLLSGSLDCAHSCPQLVSGPLADFPNTGLHDR